MKKVAVLGAGLVGGPIARDLIPDFEVHAFDNDLAQLQKLKELQPEVLTTQQDLSNPEAVTNLLAGFDFAVNAVPGFMGFATARAILNAEVNSVCIAFYEEDPFELDQLAKEKGVTMIMDCGICPGMNNILIMDAVNKLGKVESVVTYVGGLPVVREWPSEYKAVFSPIDVIEEYLRPARMLEHGVEVSKPALSEPEFIDFPEIGTLEAFNTDGLRTMIKTIGAPNMKEKTLRYPGHIEKMAVLRELGFFSKEESLEIKGKQLSPLQMTAKVLFPNWQLKDGEEDITIFQCIVEGERDGRRQRTTINMIDRYDQQSNVISMARTTGYTATMALRMIDQGLYSHKGISPPEFVGRDSDCVDFLLQGLRSKGINYIEEIISL